MQQAACVSDETAFFYLGELIEVDRTDKILQNQVRNGQKIMSQEDLDNGLSPPATLLLRQEQNV